MTDSECLLELAAARLTLAAKSEDALRTLGLVVLADRDLKAALEHVRVEAVAQLVKPVKAGQEQLL